MNLMLDIAITFLLHSQAFKGKCHVQRSDVMTGWKCTCPYKTMSGTVVCHEHSAESSTTTIDNTAEPPGWDITQDD